MLWERGKYFLLPWLVCFSAGIISVYICGKENLHLLLNAWQPRSADAFFSTLTLLGQGVAVAAAIFYMLFRSKEGALFVGTSWLATFLVIQFLKLVVFADSLRPASVFKDQGSIYFIEGIKYHHQHSFPSGHTGEVFSVFFALTLISYKPRTGFILFIPAFFVAYSRVFLSQHFMQDILGASFISIVCTSLIFGLWWRKSERFRKYIDRH